MKLPKAWHTKVCSSPVERSICEVISFWWPKANARYDGHKWLVLSISEWIEKTAGQSSDRTIRRALKHLEAEGIIITRRGKHPWKYPTQPALWVRPNEVGIDRQLTGKRPASDRQVTETIIQLNSYTAEQTDKKKVADADAPQDQEDQMTKTTGADFLMKKKAGATVASAVGAVTGEKLGPKDFPIVKTAEQAHKALVAACRGAGYPSPGALTMKRAGQMKTMLKRIAGEFEDGDSADIVAPLLFFICSKWAEFQGWSKTKFNANVGGTVPNHDALTMYAVEAVGFWQSYTVSSTVQEKPSAGNSNLNDDF